MRNALLVLLFVVLSSSASFAEMPAERVVATSLYATPLRNPAPNDVTDGTLPEDAKYQSLIPVRDEALSSATLVDESPVSASLPESSAVEAIPTPTAFHAGGCLLLLILLSRCIRKVRWS
jgi:hypothetical protein